MLNHFPATSEIDKKPEYNEVFKDFPFKNITHANSLLATHWLNVRSYSKPVMLVMLRHSGCIFCASELEAFESQLDIIHDAGFSPVVVHMGMSSNPVLAEMLETLPVPVISDPEQFLYRHFEIPRTGFKNIFNFKNIKKALVLYRRGFRPATIGGDIFQMPGLIVLRKGKKDYCHHYSNISDGTPYREICLMPYAA